METWRDRILNSPLEWLLILIGVALCIQNRSRRSCSDIYPLGLFAALMLVATLGVLTVTPRYSLAFVPALDLLAGLTLVPSLGPLRRPASFAVVALAVAGLYGIAWYQVAHRPHNPNPRSAAVLTYIHQNELENKAVFAPQDRPSDAALLFPWHAAARLFRTNSCGAGWRGLPGGRHYCGNKTLTPSRPATITCGGHPEKQPVLHHAHDAIQFAVPASAGDAIGPNAQSTM